jgi:hypothetical protein
MRTLAGATLVLLALFIPSRSHADPIAAGTLLKVQTTATSGAALARFGNGGPFRADLPGDVNDFLSFCLEVNEHFTPGEDLRVGSVSNEATRGGFAGQDTPTGDRISGKTAFLYTQFRNGIAGYTDARLIQEAIWTLENEVSTTGAGASALLGKAGVDMTAAGWGVNDLGNVLVMNLFRGAQFATYAQDMLFLRDDPVPERRVPEPATLVLLGLGLIGIGSMIRRRGLRQH